MMKISLILVLISLLTVDETYKAKVIGVTSGDAIVVLLDNNKQVKVRLEGIDCPELKQEYGDSAKMATVALCFKKRVRVETVGLDHYGRTLAFVYVGDVCVNKELLRKGLAWHYVEFNSDPELAQLETEARNNKVGLWQQPEPIAPWDFRYKKKE
jgi:endonuclease YncB( thermonuclease family)